MREVVKRGEKSEREHSWTKKQKEFKWKCKETERFAAYVSY